MDNELAPSAKAGLILTMAEQASTCPACDLSETRTKVVFGDGNADSPLMLIGEGPGANEDATGLPFIGRAGKLLDESAARGGHAAQAYLYHQCGEVPPDFAGRRGRSVTARRAPTRQVRV